MIRAALIALLIALAMPAFAVTPAEELDDPALETRARAISAELRCLVCQNQSIDSSDAELARDLRVLVRERLQAGDTDDEVFSYVTDRYGAFVLLRPPVGASTYILWGAPFVVLVIAALLAAVYLRRRTATPTAPLTSDERAELDAYLNERRDG